MRPLEPPLRKPGQGDSAGRAPGSRPSLRGGPAHGLPGSPQIDVWGAETLTRSAAPHAALPRKAPHQPIPHQPVPHQAGPHQPVPHHRPAPHHRPDAATDARPSAVTAQQSKVRTQWLQWLWYAVPGRDRRAPKAARRVSRPDPAPSRLVYRLHRWWLTPFFRRSLTIGVPVFAVVLAIGVTLADAGRQQALSDRIDAIHAGFIDRPEFAVTEVRVRNASEPLERAVRARIDTEFPVSSFRLDLADMRSQIEALDAVARVDLRVVGEGVLDVQVTERVPAAVWRAPDGLKLLDVEGQRIAQLRARSARADLPLLAGAGANAHVAEALALLQAAEPLSERVRGLVRIGERRWDLVLDRDQRIMLPETGALAAVERAVALEQAEEVLAREVAVLDLRLTRRPVVRLNPDAVEAYHAIR